MSEFGVINMSVFSLKPRELGDCQKEEVIKDIKCCTKSNRKRPFDLATNPSAFAKEMALLVFSFLKTNAKKSHFQN